MGTKYKFNFDLLDSKIFWFRIPVMGVGKAGREIVTEFDRQSLHKEVECSIINDEGQLVLYPGSLPIIPSPIDNISADTSVDSEYWSENLENGFQSYIAATVPDILLIVTDPGFEDGKEQSLRIARMAHSLDILTVVIAPEPSKSDGQDQIDRVGKGIAQLLPVANSCIMVKNIECFGRGDELTNEEMQDSPAESTIHVINDMLTSVLSSDPLVRIDFNDLVSLVYHGGVSTAFTGTVSAVGHTDRVLEAFLSPLSFTDYSTQKAKKILSVITGSENMNFKDIVHINDSLQCRISPDTEVLLSIHVDDTMNEELRITFIGTGLGSFEDI
ncbi:hypothetical protein K8I28_00895 [bacterium]|nr:hypothetical protein [bacterium]